MPLFSDEAIRCISPFPELLRLAALGIRLNYKSIPPPVPAACTVLRES
jgi:hypothetical protein